MERTGANWSQFSLPWSTQPVSTGLFTNLKCSMVLKHLLETNIHQLFCFLIEVLHKWFCCVWHRGQTQQQGFLSLCSFLILSESCFVAWLHLPIDFCITFFMLPGSYRNSLNILSSALPLDEDAPQLLSNFSKSSSRPSFSTLPTIHPMWCTQYMSRQFTPDVLPRSGCTHRRGDHNLVSHLFPMWICTPVCCGNKEPPKWKPHQGMEPVFLFSSRITQRTQ